MNFAITVAFVYYQLAPESDWLARLLVHRKRAVTGGRNFALSVRYGLAGLAWQWLGRPASRSSR